MNLPTVSQAATTAAAFLRKLTAPRPPTPPGAADTSTSPQGSSPDSFLGLPLSAARAANSLLSATVATAAVKHGSKGWLSGLSKLLTLSEASQAVMTALSLDNPNKSRDLGLGALHLVSAFCPPFVRGLVSIVATALTREDWLPELGKFLPPLSNSPTATAHVDPSETPVASVAPAPPATNPEAVA